MAEQKITVQKVTVTLHPRQVADLKQFVREELRKEREAGQGPVAPASPLASEAQMAREQLEILRSDLAGFALWCEQYLASEAVRVDIAPRLRNIQRGQPWRDL